MQPIPSPGYSLTIRTRYKNQVGMLGHITSALGEAGGDISAIDIVETGGGFITRDITVNVRDAAHGQVCVEAVRCVPNLRIINVSDRVFLLHLGGKLEITPRVPIKTRDDLMMAYMPGVARVARAVRDDPDKVFTLTIKRNSVAVVTDGTAVAGLGALGAAGALPVMEGKAVLFKELAGVDAFPLSLDVSSVDEFVAAVKAVAPVFGAIDLEGIGEPNCFEVERQLQGVLDIPIFHGDHDGVAIIVLAALLNVSKLLQRNPGEIKVLISGVTDVAAACARMLLEAGVTQVVVDAGGLITGGQTGLAENVAWLAEKTNPGGLEGDVRSALPWADVYVALKGSQPITAEEARLMGENAVVFALGSFTSGMAPEELAGAVRILATGRSDYPNQINSTLCVPGLFRGLLDARARRVTDSMKLAVARTIADLIPVGELHEEYIVPNIFDRRVVPAVARAVVSEAEKAGVIRPSTRST